MKDVKESEFLNSFLFGCASQSENSKTFIFKFIDDLKDSEMFEVGKVEGLENFPDFAYRVTVRAPNYSDLNRIDKWGIESVLVDFIKIIFEYNANSIRNDRVSLRKNG